MTHPIKMQTKYIIYKKQPLLNEQIHYKITRLDSL